MCPEAAQAVQRQARPLWLAGIIAAVAVPIGLWASIVALEVARGGSLEGEMAMRGLGATLLFGVPMSLGVMFLFGYPLALLLRRWGRLSALNLCVGATVIGSGFAFWARRLRVDEPADFQLPLMGGALGLFAAIVFCLAAGIPLRRSSP